MRIREILKKRVRRKYCIRSEHIGLVFNIWKWAAKERITGLNIGHWILPRHKCHKKKNLKIKPTTEVSSRYSMILE